MNNIFPDFSLSSVLVVGDVMLDRYYYGNIERISSEAPVSIVDVSMVEDRPGGAANVAANIASLGAHTKLISVIGNDDIGEILKGKLNFFNVNCDFINSDYPTIVKVRVSSGNQHLIRLDFGKKYEDIDVSSFVNRIKLALSNVNVLILSDYNKGVLSTCIEEIIVMARKYAVPVIVDPKRMNFFRYKGATLLTPNLSEFEYASNYYYKKEDVLIHHGMEMISQFQLSGILITRSEYGMTLLQKGEKPLYFPSVAKVVSDVTGAGDTVVGVLGASLSSGKDLKQSCFLANIAAGLVVGKFGTSVVSYDELKNVFNDQEDVIFGILCENDLIRNVNLIRNKGEKIVMTNGVFDILHTGHISYLSQAKSLGDKLIVAVNSDESTKRLKGQGRPINSLEKRMFVLSSLKMVDWVVSFNEDSPRRLIANLLPDFLVKGGDYRYSNVEGSQEVLDNGGQVHILNFELDSSTTKIVNFLNKGDLEVNDA